MEQPDFLRHVASKVLTPNNLDLKRLDDVRRLLAYAESKYKFSSYGGDPKKITDYLLSPDFTELELVIGVELAKKLLQEIINSYNDENIKKAAEKVLQEIDGYKDMEDSDAVVMYKKY
ncbi:hypothetical protein [Acidianus brierleyi]|uniref:Uncharacterized protein n=1 Tax=Acidianus brierleyi TaxID=41673 RepID=A0A2U9IGD9_9CREN|nr:hypothetical protein [Acidianus brierleyi]AWR94994.1 hypothetical protein DFR85_10690 [Acidianus brierleyi]